MTKPLAAPPPHNRWDGKPCEICEVAAPLPEPLCTCKHMDGHQGCVKSCDVSCGCVLHDNDPDNENHQFSPGVEGSYFCASPCDLPADAALHMKPYGKVSPLPEIASEPVTITRRTFSDPDEVAALLDEIHKDVQGKIHDEWDWMNASFYTECLRCMVHYAREPTPSPVPLGEPAQTFEEIISLLKKAKVPIIGMSKRSMNCDQACQFIDEAIAALATKAVPIGEGELPAYDVTDADRNRARGCEGGPQAYAAFHMRERQLLQSQQREREWHSIKEQALTKMEQQRKRAELAEARLRSQERPEDAWQRGFEEGVGMAIQKAEHMSPLHPKTKLAMFLLDCPPYTPPK